MSIFFYNAPLLRHHNAEKDVAFAVLALTCFKEAGEDRCFFRFCEAPEVCFQLLQGLHGGQGSGEVLVKLCAEPGIQLSDCQDELFLSLA